MRWVENGIKGALYIEDIGRSVECRLDIYDKSKDYNDKDRYNSTSVYKATTVELEEWIDNAKQRLLNKADNEEIYFSVGFLGREPFSVNGVKEPSGKVIAKWRNGYVFEISDKGWKSSPNIQQALVFDSVDDAKSILHFWQHYKIRFVKAENKMIIKPYRIYVHNTNDNSGYYISKLTKGGLKGCRDGVHGIGFTSEQVAQKYIDTKLKVKQWQNPIEFKIIQIPV